MRVERGEALTVGAIVLIAVATRLFALDAGLWYDEVYTLTHYVREPLGQLLGDFSSLNNHMFYSLQAKAAIALFGESNWALRLPAVVFGIGSIIVLWAMARATAGRAVALFATLLLAISYHHVWFSQNARGYTGMLFWTSLATLLFIAGLRQSGWRIWFAYGLCLAAGVYTHLSAGFFFASHAVVYAIAWMTRRADMMEPYRGLDGRGPILGFATGGLLTLLLHLPLLAQVVVALNKVSKSGSGSSMAEWVDPFRAVREIMFSMSALGPLAPLALGGGVALFLIGVIVLWRKAPIFVGIYVLSIPLTLVILLTVQFRIWPRYFFVDIGVILLCAATGVHFVSGWVGDKLRRPAVSRVLFALGVVIASAASLLLLTRNYAYPKQDFDGAVALIASKSRGHDVATSFGLASEPIRTYFAPNWPVVASADDLDRITAGNECVWLITAFDDRARPEQKRTLGLIKRSFAVERSFEGTLGGGTVRVYRKGASCPN